MEHALSGLHVPLRAPSSHGLPMSSHAHGHTVLYRTHERTRSPALDTGRHPCACNSHAVLTVCPSHTSSGLALCTARRYTYSLLIRRGRAKIPKSRMHGFIPPLPTPLEVSRSYKAVAGCATDVDPCHVCSSRHQIVGWSVSQPSLCCVAHGGGSLEAS